MLIYVGLHYTVTILYVNILTPSVPQIYQTRNLVISAVAKTCVICASDAV